MEKLFFLRPDKDNNEVLKNILEVIKNSRKLYLCISYFSSPDISKALIDRIKTKKETLMIINTHDIIWSKQEDSTLHSILLDRIHTIVCNKYDELQEEIKVLEGLINEIAN